jgi:hypothetical protein
MSLPLSFRYTLDQYRSIINGNPVSINNYTVTKSLLQTNNYKCSDFTCSQCPLNSTVSSDLLTCNCNNDYELYNDKCVPKCGYGQVRNSIGNCVCEDYRRIEQTVPLKCGEYTKMTILDSNGKGIGCKEKSSSAYISGRQQECVCVGNLRDYDNNGTCKCDTKQRESKTYDNKPTCVCASNYCTCQGGCISNGEKCEQYGYTCTISTSQ